MYVGSALSELSISNPDAGAALIEGINTETSNVILGGFQNDDNGKVGGNGTLIISKERKPGSLQITVANNMGAADPQFEFCQRVQNSLNESTFTFSYHNGAVYSGSGTIVGEVTLDTKASTFSFKVASGKGFVLQ